MSTTLGKSSGVDPAESTSGDGTTTGPWPMWCVSAKGPLRAEELTVGKVSLVEASDLDSGVASVEEDSEIAKQSATKEFIMVSGQRETKALRCREEPKHHTDRKLLLYIIMETRIRDQ